MLAPKLRANENVTINALRLSKNLHFYLILLEKRINLAVLAMLFSIAFLMYINFAQNNYVCTQNGNYKIDDALSRCMLCRWEWNGWMDGWIVFHIYILYALQTFRLRRFRLSMIIIHPCHINHSNRFKSWVCIHNRQLRFAFNGCFYSHIYANSFAHHNWLSFKNLVYSKLQCNYNIFSCKEG